MITRAGSIPRKEAMSAEATLLSLHVGRVREHEGADGRPWRSAILKVSVAGPVRLGTLGLEGDEVGNTRHHGGPHKAVLAYASEHYAAWGSEGVLEGGPGGFGENLALRGLTESEVCVGDVFELGEALLQVSQPRQPCHTLVQRWGVPDLVERVWACARTGWYARVLREGWIEAGQVLRLRERPHAGWTIARVLRACAGEGTSVEERLAASALRHLSPSWQDRLASGKSGR